MHANLCTCYFTRFFIYFSYRRLCITLDAKILCQTLSKHGDRFEEGSLFRQKIIQCIFMHKIKCWSYTIINNNYYYIYIDYLLVLTIINLIFLSICMRTYLSWNKLKRYPVIEKVYTEWGPIHLPTSLKADFIQDINGISSCAFNATVPYEAWNKDNSCYL